MEPIQEIFKLDVSNDKMSASLHVKQSYNAEELTFGTLKKWLNDKGIVFGIDTSAVSKLATQYNENLNSIEIATGTPPIHGVNGKIDFLSEQDDVIGMEEKRNFRDVKKIPTLTTGEKIAKITDPTFGTPGRNIFNKVLPAKPGKPVRMRAGKNVEYKEEERTFYATADGKMSVGSNKIHVYNTYEVQGDLSLKTGNLKFIGSIIIRGNVPAGYRVEAEGDIHIYGLVESAYIEAGGSVFISEGIAGLRKGTVIAGVDVTIGYVNQAIIESGRNIIVQNSIMHSHCVAKQHIYCKSGNIIGGVCSAGMTIEAKDVGNKMNTKTEIAIGINQENHQQEAQLTKEKEEILSNIEKLRVLGDNLKAKEKMSEGLNSKERILLLKQRNTMQQAENKLSDIEAEIGSLQVELGDIDQVKLIVKGSLYPNVDLNFGKYKKTIKTVQKFTQVYLDNGEITAQPL
ncbi:polymerase [Paraliobacillus quinghaiensis]|uniref:Polymerase n=1 Tax=Paraliobacillus quinghaiensis TaxID=470815 RepID=A0A917TG88_9BACI|nr:FapA family protein [Paraliobacillus quinghaiensis]GGM21592.1 polymerase [Paraliobacillus quinghaiensis]